MSVLPVAGELVEQIVVGHKGGETSMNLNEVTLLVIDKVLFGLLIVFTGFFLKRALTQFQARQALAAKLAEERVTRIGKTWSQIYEHEKQVFKYLAGRREAIKMALQKFPHDEEAVQKEVQHEIKPLGMAVIASSRAAETCVDEHRFWLGESVYERFQDHFTKIRELMSSEIEMNFQEVERLIPEFERERLSILDYVREAMLKSE